MPYNFTYVEFKKQTSKQRGEEKREASTNEQRESQVDSEVRMVHFMILRLWDGLKRKWYAFSKNGTFEFGSFLGLVICGTVLSPDAGRRQPAATPGVNKAITRVNNQHADNRPVFCFQYLVPRNYTRYSTLYYKTGLLLGDFVQLWANIGVSTCKVGWAKLWCSVG